jgi:tetratricopeptide (TPR) repeat protein
MELRLDLIQLLERTREEEELFIARLSPQEREQPGRFDAWSAKDLMSHLAAWRMRMADRMETAHEGGTRAADAEPDTENAAIWAEYNGKSWDEVRQTLALSHRRLVGGLEGLADDELTDPQRFEWQLGQPLWRGLAGNGCTHPVMHLADAYVRRGQEGYAADLMEEVSARLAALEDAPRWKGVVRYNLACFYALAGVHDRAIEHLRQALTLHPGLKEWSKEDTDLASLHGTPEYDRLYAA